MSEASVPRRPGAFVRLWSATATTNLSDGIVLVGFPLLAAELTRSPFLVSLIATLVALPWLLVTLPAGAMADRYDRRRIIVSASGVRAAVLLAVASLALQHDLELFHLYVAVLLLGVAEVISDTTTQAMVPMVVDRERLALANGRLTAAQRTAQDFLGAPLGGVLIAVGAVALLGVPALLYAIGGILALTVRGRFSVNRPERPALLVDIGEAMRYLVGNRVLRALAVLAGAGNFAMAAYLGVFVLWATGDESAMQLDPSLYGLLFAASAAGAVGGALLAEHAARLGSEAKTMLFAATGASSLLIVPLLAPHLAAVLPAFVVVGLGGALTNVLIVTIRQRLIPDELLGRVNAAYRLIGMGALPLGALVGGAAGSLFGLEAVFIMSVAVSLAGVLYASRNVSDLKVRLLSHH